MNGSIRAALIVILVGAGTLSFTGTAQAATRQTGEDCTPDYIFNGATMVEDGSRCAEGRIHYSKTSSHRWKITTYKMYYFVTPGLSHGPHNNERPYKIATGFSSGTRSWDSPDSGDSNVWIKRNPPNAITWSGQTEVQIDAYPDIPSAKDPHENCDTATW